MYDFELDKMAGRDLLAEPHIMHPAKGVIYHRSGRKIIVEKRVRFKRESHLENFCTVFAFPLKSSGKSL